MFGVCVASKLSIKKALKGGGSGHVLVCVTINLDMHCSYKEIVTEFEHMMSFLVGRPRLEVKRLLIGPFCALMYNKRCLYFTIRFPV